MARESKSGEHAVTATEARRSFSAILDRIERGERVIIERRGRAVCVIVPPTPRGRRGSECVRLLREREPVLLDDRFGADLAEIVGLSDRR